MRRDYQSVINMHACSLFHISFACASCVCYSRTSNKYTHKHNDKKTYTYKGICTYVYVKHIYVPCVYSKQATMLRRCYGFFVVVASTSTRVVLWWRLRNVDAGLICACVSQIVLFPPIHSQVCVAAAARWINFNQPSYKI